MSVARLAAAVWLLWSGWSWAAAASVPAPVRIATGLVQGHIAGNTVRYLGIPYAAPPIGPLRWQPPQAVAPWSGVRTADHYGSACAQIGGYFASNDAETFGKPYGDEDCLYLNVWAPVAARPADAAPRPVLVYIHGGSGIYGAASLPLYEATRLASELDAVVVSLNYRLGFFGAMSLRSLRPDGPESYALLDQIQALRWVRRNVAAFGGNPENVTVMGYSAGAVSIWGMLQSPRASGLFNKAMILSGIPLRADPDKAEAYGRAWVAQVLQHDRRISDDEQLPVVLEQLGDAGLNDYLRARSAAELLDAGRTLGPPPSKSVEAPQIVNAVPTIVGSVDNEASMLLVKRYCALSPLQLWELINSGRDDLSARDFFGFWASIKFRVATAVTNWRLHDLVDRSADQIAAENVPVYRYAFEWSALPSPWGELFGTFHGLDVPFLFGNFPDHESNFTRFAWTPQNRDGREQLHGELVTAIKGFLETADPGRDPSSVQWHRWDQERRYTVLR